MKEKELDTEVLSTTDKKITNKKPSWLKFSSFQEIFIYFWISSIIGHYLEVVWAYTKHLMGGPLWMPTINTIIPLAVPYGLGAVAVILLTWPLMKTRKLHVPSVFALNVFTTGAIEYFCAMIIVLFNGTNNYWNYSGMPFNLNGYTSLETSIGFGIAATVYLYYIYPFFKKAIDRLKQKHFSYIFWILFITYAADLIYSLIK